MSMLPLFAHLFLSAKLMALNITRIEGTSAQNTEQFRGPFIVSGQTRHRKRLPAAGFEPMLISAILVADRQRSYWVTPTHCPMAESFYGISGAE